ncbi:ELWxxDGT repeat protein [Vitiosangium sp. GDMCC 1.1324]|uniref:ELWxxDGT repeat protein n=1 Tax=Vitiosangium sp. (strain GDMCC 1.1324) TaxID=2138576 RepID=UPI00130D7F0D|nr:ELWxxDGT repeat protein [Vitiosangium sp. GDMCC 1.1324]
MTAQWGSPALGTARLVKDIFPQQDVPAWFGPFPESLVEFRGKLYFAANFNDGRRELWKSDGTLAGTVPIKRFPPFPGSSFSSMRELTPLGSKLFFVVSDEAHGRELWVSDGTTGGTHLVKDITPGAGDSNPNSLRVVGSTLLFFTSTLATPTTPEHTELWKSDGTEAGTVRVKDLGADTSVGNALLVVNDTLYFNFTEPAHGSELWKTDGTDAGTQLVKDINPGPDSSFPFELRAVGSDVFFTATEPAHGNELWRSDGTSAGTELIADVTPGPDSNFIRVLEPIGNCLYFSTSDPSTRRARLYKLKDATGDAHVKLVTTLPNPFSQPNVDGTILQSVVANGKLYFELAFFGFGPAPVDSQLWVSDGTSSGTKLLHRPLSLNDEFGSTMFALDDRVLFSGFDSATSLELWVTNGTVKDTRLLQDIAPGPNASYPRSFTRVGSKVFFVANDAVHGNELWVLPLLNSQQGANETAGE